MTRRVVARLVLLALAGVVAGCQPGGRTEVSDPDMAKVPPDSQVAEPKEPAQPGAPDTTAVRIAVVPKAVTHQFWNTVRAGAEAAGEEFGAEILWKGPDHETDVDAQKGMIQDFVTQQVDAIVMAACDADALVPEIQDAEAAGVPVITIDSGVNYDDVRSLVATDNVAAARVAGEKLVELIGGKGTVGLIPFVKGAASSEEREQGFREAIAAAAGVELGPVLYSESDVGTGKDVATDMLVGHPDLAGIFAANEAGAIGAANAIAEQAKIGKVLLVGFDGSPDEIRLLREGVIQALVVQNPYQMGYDGVRLAVDAIAGKVVPKRIDTGVVVVTPDNVDSDEIQKLIRTED